MTPCPGQWITELRAEHARLVAAGASDLVALDTAVALLDRRRRVPPPPRAPVPVGALLTPYLTPRRGGEHP